ncbi:MAG: CoB--CoM heterodisulfide reductase iron-sulfur subunit B family protein [Desulfovibrio sp.]|uniref:CoB--CoM heterodisulfide reductase iron-sulfur subunit B family protein n=1 Tax=Desulfovibrio sp. 7SRBS1 TaxID=3378064 RepID=UPI003B4193F0
MMYAYYPGCSLTESASEFDVSTRLVMAGLGSDLREIEDWTCCGASAVDSVSRLLSYSLPARNLVLSQQQMPGADVLVPCSACYLNHLRVTQEVQHDKELAVQLDEILDIEGMHYEFTGRVRHLLDVLLNDFGEDNIRQSVSHPMEGLVIAPYYGCQILRPYPVFDDPERPCSMEPIIRAMGARSLDWDQAGKCCGASLMATKRKAALVSVNRILDAAADADVIATVCPMCQMNLEAYQREASRAGGHRQEVPVLYLPQIMGLAMGMSASAMRLGTNLTMTTRLEEILFAGAAAAATEPA